MIFVFLLGPAIIRVKQEKVGQSRGIDKFAINIKQALKKFGMKN